MLKKTITFEDFNGVTRTEDFYFNLTKAEIMEMQLSEDGGMSGLLEKIVQEQKKGKIVEIFKDIILKAYGQKSADGRRFMKNSEIVDSFKETEAYSKLFMELVNDEDVAADFVKGIMPKELHKMANDAKQLAK